MRRALRFLADYGVFVALGVLFTVLAASDPDVFLSQTNLLNILRQNAVPAVLATAMTLTILTGGIDLSVGAVVSLGGVACATVLAHGGGVATAILAAVATGGLVGLVNATLVTAVRIPPFIATLATMLVARGISLKSTNARTVALPPDAAAAFTPLADGVVPVLVFAGVLVAAWVLLTRTAFGRHVYAVGGNAAAARLAGIRVRRVLVGVYGACGLLAGLAASMNTARIGAGDPNGGLFFELDAVAAAVVGGTSLFGGRGSVWGTLGGALFLGVLNNGMNLWGVGQYDQLIAKGLVLLVATSTDLWRGRDQG